MVFDLRSYTLYPPRGVTDNPEINPITCALYSGVFYVKRTVKRDDAQAFGASRLIFECDSRFVRDYYNYNACTCKTTNLEPCTLASKINVDVKNKGSTVSWNKHKGPSRAQLVPEISVIMLKNVYIFVYFVNCAH